MKKKLNIAVLVLTIALLSSVFIKAGGPGILHVNVPFDFYVGKELMPAGSYIVQLDRITQASALGSRLVFSKKGGEIRHTVTTLPGQADRLESGSRLAFRKYDDTYFLSQIRSEGAVCQLIRSKAEKETAAQFSGAQSDVTLKAE